MTDDLETGQARFTQAQAQSSEAAMVSMYMAATLVCYHFEAQGQEGLAQLWWAVADMWRNSFRKGE